MSPQDQGLDREVYVVAGVVIVGVIMSVLDMTIVNVALETLSRQLDAPLDVIQWVATGYLLAVAIVIPLTGWASERWGAKKVWMTSVGLFGIGSALCGLAWSDSSLIAFRVLQGFGGGMLMPVGMAILFRLAPPDRRGAVMGIFGIPMLLGPALGPVISGWLLEYASWPWIFLINVPVGAAAVAIGLRSLPSLAAEHTESRLDTLGTVLGPLAFASLTYGISQSTEAGWTGRSTVTGITVGLAALTAFIARELTTTHPLLELRVFKNRDFSLAIMTQWLMIAGMFGTFFLIPVFLQQVRGYSPFQTGLITLPNALVAAMTMPLAGRLFDKVGARPPVFVGLLIVMSAFWMLSGISATTTAWDLMVPLAVMGGGMGLAMMPLGTHVLNTAPRHLVSRVTSLTGSCQNVVASLAIASFTTVLQNRFVANAAGGQLSPEAQAQSFGDVYGFALLVIAFAAASTLLLRRPRSAPGVSEPRAELVSSAT